MQTIHNPTVLTDDFGNERRIVYDLSIDAMNANIRALIDAQCDGIADGTISGNVDDACLRFYGLVA